jgi:hypothetical protein
MVRLNDSDIMIYRTEKYYVYDILLDGKGKHPDVGSSSEKNEKGFIGSSTLLQYSVDYTRKNLDNLLHRYDTIGFCIFQNIFSTKLLEKARKSLLKFANSLISRYDFGYDEFDDIDTEFYNITRMPRIGKGKHNIHFDPEFSSQHAFLVEMIEESKMLDMLSLISQKTCSLRETGMSLTCPKHTSVSFSGDNGNGSNLTVAGEGMEWHSDGAKGEYTMLMSIIEDVTWEMGSLRIVPGSHLEYVDGTGHDEVKYIYHLSSRYSSYSV